jgi:hypothetical protein
LLVAADALVARLRARVDAWAFEDMADQRDTLSRLVEAEETVAELRGVNESADLPELRQRLAEVTRRAEDRGRPSFWTLPTAAPTGQVRAGNKSCQKSA